MYDKKIVNYVELHLYHSLIVFIYLIISYNIYYSKYETSHMTVQHVQLLYT